MFTITKELLYFLNIVANSENKLSFSKLNSSNSNKSIIIFLPLNLTLDFGFKENINLFKSDLRDLSFKDKSFDYTITNATIHHIDLPHKAITELYRVAIKGVLIIESNDSLIMRLATKIKLAEENANLKEELQSTK